MGALVFAQVPHAYGARSVAADEFTLVRVYCHVIDGGPALIISLNCCCSRIPKFHSPIFRARDHPFAVYVKRDAGHVVGMALEHKYRGWIGGFHVE